MEKAILLIVLLFNLQFIHSQELPNNIKNKMVEFLISEKQYQNDDIPSLLEDTKTDKGILFYNIPKEVSCKMGIRVFYFGSSASHTKNYILLLKETGEYLFLGSDLKQESQNNSIYNFVHFYDEKSILCFYNNIFPLILKEVYLQNSQIPNIKLSFFN